MIILLKCLMFDNKALNFVESVSLPAICNLQFGYMLHNLSNAGKRISYPFRYSKFAKQQNCDAWFIIGSLFL